MSDEAAVTLFPTHTVRLHGLHLHVVVTDEVNGLETEGALHIQHTGKVGLSKPYWTHSQDIAAKCIPILEDALRALSAVATDPGRWPTWEQEQAGLGQEPPPPPQEE